MNKKIKSKQDPIRPSKAEDAKELKETYGNWENYKVLTTQRAVREQRLKKFNIRLNPRGVFQ